MKKIIYILTIVFLMTITLPFMGYAEPDPHPQKGEQSLNQNNKIYWQNKVAVLMYHLVDNELESSSTITPKLFASHLDMLQEKGYNVISLQQMAKFLEGENTVPPNALAITFDDGYQSVYKHAFPLLKECKIPASVFMIVSKVSNVSGEIPKLSWSQMREMAQEEIYTYSHSYDSHYYVTVRDGEQPKPVLVVRQRTADGSLETHDEYKWRIYKDLLKSRQQLENELGYPVNFFSAPFGWVSVDLIKVAHYAGFRYIFTIKPGLNSRATPSYGLQRINAGSPWITADTLHDTLQGLK